MLKIVVPGVEAFDNLTQEFITLGNVALELQHSLVSLSKWESEFEKPFLGKDEKTSEEVRAYVRAMCLTPDVPKDVWTKLSEENFSQINEYLDAKMTATTVYEMMEPPKTKQEIVTAELVYYWMTVFNIPWEAQHWHLNRLFTLIRVCTVKGEKPKKMSRSQIAARQRAENERRKAKYKTKG